MEHPSQDALLRFVLGAASRQENRLIVRHLLARCPACAAAVRECWPGEVDGSAEAGRLSGSFTTGNAARWRFGFG